MNRPSKIRALAIAFAAQVGRLGLRPEDKWAHAIVGLAATLALAAFDNKPKEIFAAVLVAALLKELADMIDGSEADLLDLAATVAPPLALWAFSATFWSPQ